MSDKSSPLSKCILWVYVMLWVVALVAAGAWLTSYLMGTLGDPFASKEAQAANADMFDDMVSLTEKKVVRHLGEWEFNEPKIPGHFHHIGRWYQSDEWNFCIKCHGPTPHSRSAQVRAFLNMHNLFISCQVCHVRQQADVIPTRFGWMDMDNGEACASPDMVNDASGEYGAKISLMKGPESDPRPMRLEEEEAFAVKYIKRMDQLDDRQKVVGNKNIHKLCVDKPTTCTDCHDSRKAFLPYTSLGYSAERSAFLMSTEVADLATSYEAFHIPSLLDTNGNGAQGTGDGTE